MDPFTLKWKPGMGGLIGGVWYGPAGCQSVVVGARIRKENGVPVEAVRVIRPHSTQKAISRSRKIVNKGV